MQSKGCGPSKGAEKELLYKGKKEDPKNKKSLFMKKDKKNGKR